MTMLASEMKQTKKMLFQYKEKYILFEILYFSNDKLISLLKGKFLPG